MLDVHILLHVFLYIAFLLLILTLAASGVYLVRIFKRRTLTKGAVADLEANMSDHQAKMSPITLPPRFYLDPVVYPPAAKVSMSSMRRLSTTTVAKLENLNNNHQNSAPVRPPRSTRLDDLLAGFPHESHVSRDIWFPIINKKTRLCELGVIRHSMSAAPNSRHRTTPINTRINAITSKRASFPPFQVLQ